MKLHRTVARMAAVGAVSTLMLALGACIPPDGGGTTTTTSAAPDPGIAIQCHDGGGNDLEYTGPADTVNNAKIHQTLNGTCGQFVAFRTLVKAPTKPQAVAICASIGQVGGASGPLNGVNNYPTLVDVYECF